MTGLSLAMCELEFIEIIDSRFFQLYFLPSWEALNTTPLHSKENPFILPVEAMLHFAVMPMLFSFSTKSSIAIGFNVIESIPLWMMDLGHGSPVLSSNIASLRDFLSFTGEAEGFRAPGPLVLVNWWSFSSSWMIRVLIRFSFFPR